MSKAKFGARIAYDMARKYSDDASGYLSPATLGEEQGTLTPDDLEPAWRGGSTGA
jgi:hypothetical protein